MFTGTTPLFIVLLQKEALRLFLYAAQFFWNRHCSLPPRYFKAGMETSLKPLHHFQRENVFFHFRRNWNLGATDIIIITTYQLRVESLLIPVAYRQNGNNLPHLERKQICEG